MTKAFELSSKTWRTLLKPWRSKAPIAGSGSRFFRAWSRPELNLQHSKAQGFKAQILQAPSNSTLQLGVPSPQKPNGHYFECQQTIFCSRESSFRLSDKSRVFFLSFSHQMSPHVVEKILIDNSQHRLATQPVIKCCSTVVELPLPTQLSRVRIGMKN